MPRCGRPKPLYFKVLSQDTHVDAGLTAQLSGIDAAIRVRIL